MILDGNKTPKKDKEMTRFPKNRVDLRRQIEYIYERINPDVVRRVASLNDEAIRLSVAVMICEWTKGVKVVPSKQHRVKFASALKAKGLKMRRVCELTGICKNTYYSLGDEDGR